MINRIEIDFALPVEPDDIDYRDLDTILSRICRNNCPKGWAFWPAGHGSKPTWSQADARLLGKPVDPNTPETGEPTWDDTVYSVDCAARELRPEEIAARSEREAAKRRKEASLRFRVCRFFRRVRQAWREA